MDIMNKKLYLVTINDIYKKSFINETFSNGERIYSSIPYEESNIKEISKMTNQNVSFIIKHSIPISDKIYNHIKSSYNRIISYDKNFFLEKFNLQEWII